MEKCVRDLHQNARAVAGVGFAAARAAMVQIYQHRQRLLHEGMRALPLDIDDKADAAGVMLIPRVVETLLWR